MFCIFFPIAYRIAGLQTDTHLKGNQFNTALAGKLDGQCC